MNPIDIKKPTLILDKSRAHANIRKMAHKAKNSGVGFRPHFKTHQSAQIGYLFRQEGVMSITVTNVDMAAYFTQNGWNDITIAFPVNIRQVQEINELAQKISLNLLVESLETVKFLSENLKHSVNIWIKIDVGYHRTGIASGDFETIKQIVTSLTDSEKLKYQGLLAHSGHSYHADSINEVKEIYGDTIERLNKIRHFLDGNGVSETKISIGDTPTCSIMKEFSDIDEIRPGNFVFYDVMQMLIGSCEEENIAVAVACPVVAKHQKRSEIVIYGGAVHLSKESAVLPNGTEIFGMVALGKNNGWGPVLKNSYVSAVSQEHGVVKTDPFTFQKIKIGDLIFILPVHSCLTVNLLKEMHTLKGERIRVLH